MHGRLRARVDAQHLNSATGLVRRELQAERARLREGHGDPRLLIFHLLLVLLLISLAECLHPVLFHLKTHHSSLRLGARTILEDGHAAQILLRFTLNPCLALGFTHPRWSCGAGGLPPAVRLQQLKHALAEPPLRHISASEAFTVHLRSVAVSIAEHANNVAMPMLARVQVRAHATVIRKVHILRGETW